MNLEIKNNKKFYYVDKWNTSGKIKRDSEGNEYPTPVESLSWSNEHFFTEKLKNFEDYLLKKNSTFITDERRDCILCGKKNISNYAYYYSNIIWDEGLMHYITVHHIKPPSKFIRFIFEFESALHESKQIKHEIIQGICYKVHPVVYLKVKSNQLIIIDALLESGGVTKKYLTRHKQDPKFSEHSGEFRFGEKGLEKIIIDGKFRTETSDVDIYLPAIDPVVFTHEYIFHTHPPTPTPGGRVIEGILYEFPSRDDIDMFIFHHNKGVTKGSIVITPEGLYNIHQYSTPNSKIDVDVMKMKRTLYTAMSDTQRKAIKKYGTNFDLNTFYKEIAQDFTFIEMLNETAHQFDIHIDYYPRQYNEQTNRWMIGTLYFPVELRVPQGDTSKCK